MSLTSELLINFNSIVKREPLIDLNPWFSKQNRQFSLHDTCPLKPDCNDTEILNYYGVEILRLIDKGAYSKAPIYQGVWSNVDVAIKAVKLLDNTPNRHAKQELAVVKIIDHPNIVIHYSYFRACDRIFSIMEYAGGGTLGNYIKENDFTNYRFVKIIFINVVNAVKYLHSNNIAHRDIKDSNIVLKFDPSSKIPIPKLCDFGFSAIFSSRCIKIKTYCGTRSFKSPELIHAEQAFNPFQAEIWAIGVLLHKMLCRRPPTYDPIQRKLEIYHKMIPIEANCILLEILAINPEDRISLTSILNFPWFYKNERSNKE